MLRKVKELKGFHLGALDGEIGRVKDFFFEDNNWTIRYLVADTSKWLAGRKVLISPYAVEMVRDNDRIVSTKLTKAQIKNSPTIDEDKPVSRQYELQYYSYYNWPYYWQGPGLWGPASYPAYGPETVTPPRESQSMPQASGDPHLRSTDAVTSYYIHARDGDLGHVEDFVLEDHTWIIRYLVVDTRNWWPGKKVLVACDWIGAIDWHQSIVQVDLGRETIKSAPEMNHYGPISREFETRLFKHYSREPYWGRRQMAA